MRARPSTTAMLTAFARAVASHPRRGAKPFDDPFARTLVPTALRWLLPRGADRGAELWQTAIRQATCGLVDQVALRGLAIDDVVRDAVRAGTKQLVVLGAGLDARAQRMSELADVAVYEVDRPAARRHDRARRHERTARAAVRVVVDFSREGPAAALAAGGHDRGAPTAWICEGVTMYLAREEIQRLLDDVEAASAPGSRLALTYRSASEVPFPPALMRLVGAALRAVGEPLREPIAPETVVSWLVARGFEPSVDESSIDWAARSGHAWSAPALFRSERLVVAHRSRDAARAAP